MKEIKFYRVNEKPYGCFSNFFSSPIIIDNETWPTVEHYYQAMKFPLNPEIRELIKNELKPIETKKYANKRYKDFVDWDNWGKIKTEIMLEALRIKFNQHEDLKQILLSTGDAKIIEHTNNDSFWADGGDGTGENMLGKLLMKVRDEILFDNKF